MIINGVQIDDTFAEAFNMRGTRVIITAQNHKWAYNAANAMTGFATSVIGCGVEAGIERELSLFMLQGEDIQPGDHVLVHVGYAIQKVSEEEARSAWDLFDEILEHA